MVTAQSRFSRIAKTIACKVSELLYAPVFVVDRRGKIITSSEPNRVGRTFSEDGHPNPSSGILRIPLNYETEAGEIIIEQSCQNNIPHRVAQALVELVVHQTSTQEKILNQNQLKNQFLEALLNGQIPDEEFIYRRAKRLGIDLTPPRAVILIDAVSYILNSSPAYHPDSDFVQQERSQLVINSIVQFFHLPNDTICADLGHGRIVVLKASDTKNLDLWASHEETTDGLGASWANLAALKRAANALLHRLQNDTHANIHIGIGRYHPGIDGLARSYEEARVALSLGRRFQENHQVYCLGEMGIAAFVGVADEDTKIDLAKYLLSPLDHEPDLLETLTVFFAQNCCPSSASKQLSIHRNTLSYRLDKIALLTGLEPRKFDDAVQMRLSLLLRSLQSPEVLPI